MFTNRDKEVLREYATFLLKSLAWSFARLFIWILSMIIACYGGVFIFTATLLEWWNPIVPQVAWMLRADYKPWILISSALITVVGLGVAEKVFSHIKRRLL